MADLVGLVKYIDSQQKIDTLVMHGLTSDILNLPNRLWGLLGPQWSINVHTGWDTLTPLPFVLM